MNIWNFFLLSLLCVSLTISHNCVHDTLTHEIKSIGSPETEELTNDRLLTSTYENIRIFFDFSLMTGVTDADKNYITYKLITPAKNYFEQALKVIRRTSNIIVTDDKICNDEITVPANYKTTGIDADMVIFVIAQNINGQTYGANAGPCVIDAGTGKNNRPLVGRILFNLNQISASANSVDTERNMLVSMHELTHALGFSKALFPYFVDPSTNAVLTNHLLTRTINGVSTKVLNLPSLTSRVRAYFGCSTLEGAVLENQGGDTSATSHFERRVFYNEYLTSSTLEDARISEFTLAALEGSGWYQVDYSMAEPMTWGKNEGCSFVTGYCFDKTSAKANFKEFCSSLGQRGCSWTKRGGAGCGPSTGKDTSLLSAFNYWKDDTVVYDTFSDNCPIYQVYNNLDCALSSNLAGSILPSKEFYGDGGSCFTGTLSSSGSSLTSSYTYCFKSQCTLESSGDYSLKVTVGTTEVNCDTEGEVVVAGLNGKLYCPNPNSFCYHKANEGYCERKCTGRGSCKNKVCVCEPGWSGSDCSVPSYTDNCAKCASSATSETSCYGDVCACPSGDSTCIAAHPTPNPVAFDMHLGGLTNVNNDADNLQAGPDPGDKGPTTVKSSDDSDTNILPIIIGAVGGVVVIVILIIICKCVANKKAAKGKAQAKGKPRAKGVNQNQPAQSLAMDTARAAMKYTVDTEQGYQYTNGTRV